MPQSQAAPTTRTVSFRDPVGRVILIDDRCFRVLTPAAGLVLDEFLTSEVARQATERGELIATTVPANPPAEIQQLIDSGNSDAPPRVFEHEAIAFANYPHEWCPDMFVAAAELTLNLAERVLPIGFNLKDGTPWNIMFRGTDPVFLDLASFERRDPLARLWLAYGQFVRTFLLPLLIWRTIQTPPGESFCATRDGLKPQEAFRRLGLGRALRRPGFELCAVPASLAWWARRRHQTTAQVKPRPARSPEEAGYVISGMLRRLRKSLNRLSNQEPPASEWTAYNAEVATREFASGYFPAKTEFVKDALAEIKPIASLDVGCNTGHFSLLAAATGSRVLGVDSDAASVGELYRRARAGNLDVLPLVIDIARPTPAMGWNNQESLAFLERAEAAHFDLVMMLALIHHLCLIERVPLAEVAGLAARLTQRWLLIEFVPREDPLAQAMPGFWDGDSDWSPYSRESFEAAFAHHFRIVRAAEVASSGRWIYLMEQDEKRA